jgi:hypothetical protein
MVRVQDLFLPPVAAAVGGNHLVLPGYLNPEHIGPDGHHLAHVPGRHGIAVAGKAHLLTPVDLGQAGETGGWQPRRQGSQTSLLFESDPLHPLVVHRPAASAE